MASSFVVHFNTEQLSSLSTMVVAFPGPCRCCNLMTLVALVRPGFNPTISRKIRLIEKSKQSNNSGAFLAEISIPTVSVLRKKIVFFRLTKISTQNLRQKFDSVPTKWNCFVKDENKNSTFFCFRDRIKFKSAKCLKTCPGINSKALILIDWWLEKDF